MKRRNTLLTFRFSLTMALIASLGCARAPGDNSVSTTSAIPTPTHGPPTVEKLAPAEGVPIPGSRVRVKVVQVVDGDTFWTLWEGKRRRVRLLGVDTPEHEPTRKDREHYGEDVLSADAYGRATEFLRKLIEGREVELQFGITGDQIDNTSSHRLLAYVFCGEVDVNAEICRQGFTYHYTKFSHDRLREFGEYVADAKRAGLGLWSVKTAELH